MTNNIIIENVIDLLPEEKLLVADILSGKHNNQKKVKNFNISDPSQKVTYIHNKGYRHKDAHIPYNDLVVSEYWSDVYKLFNRICLENDVLVKRVYRASVNFSGSGVGLHDVIHRDHKFDHYIFLMYLNEFNQGFTFLFEDGNIVKCITPCKNKIAIFPNMPHARGYTNPGEIRAVLVVTFEMDQKNV